MKSKDKKNNGGILDTPKDVAWNCFKGSGLLSYYLLYKKLKDD